MWLLEFHMLKYINIILTNAYKWKDHKVATCIMSQPCIVTCITTIHVFSTQQNNHTSFDNDRENASINCNGTRHYEQSSTCVDFYSIIINICNVGKKSIEEMTSFFFIWLFDLYRLNLSKHTNTWSIHHF